tara:strand:+ start:1163 stop:1717 length:555 start_codon:yes stop_codon:yes gene_type:complete
MEEESTLIDKALAGNERAFEKLLRPLQDQVYRRCLKATSDADVADDVAQEVYIKTFTKLSQFRRDSKFSTWVYVITTRCILMHFRASKRKRAERLDQVSPAEYEKALTNVSQPLISQEEFVSAVQILDSFECAMDQMNPKYNHLLTLWIKGNSLRQIGEITGLGIPATKTRIHRARQQLRRLAA